MSIPHQLVLLLVVFATWNVFLNLLFIRNAVRDNKISEVDLKAMQIKSGLAILSAGLTAIGLLYTQSITAAQVVAFIAKNAQELAILIAVIHAGVFMALTAKAGYLLFKRQAAPPRRIHPTL